MPTHGLVPHTGVFGLDPSIDYVGPMARTVTEVAARCSASRAPTASIRARRRCRPRSRIYRSAGRGVKGLRIGLLEQGFGVKAASGTSTTRS